MSTEPFFQWIRAGVEVEPLLAEIDAQPDLWNQHPFRKTFVGTAHSRMDDIWVRYNAYEQLGLHGPAQFGEEHVPVWYPAWERLPALRSIVFDLMADVQGEMLGGIFITRVPPGEGIDPHADRGWHVDYYEKFYLSLRSAPGAEFLCRGGGRTEAICPAPGEIYRFDNRRLHWVVNESDEDRVTLIVAIRTDMFCEKTR